MRRMGEPVPLQQWLWLVPAPRQCYAHRRADVSKVELMRAPEFRAVWPNQSAAFNERRFSCPVQFQAYLDAVRRHAAANRYALSFTWNGPAHVEIVRAG